MLITWLVLSLKFRERFFFNRYFSEFWKWLARESKKKISKQIDRMYKERQGELKKDGESTTEKRRGLLLRILIGDRPIDIKKIYREVTSIEIHILMWNKLIESIEENKNLSKEDKAKKQLPLQKRILELRNEVSDLKEPVSVKHKYLLNYLRVWVYALIGYLVISFVVLTILKLFEVKQNTEFIASLTVLFHFIVSWFNIVGKKECGAIYFFEKPLYNAGRGIHFVPWLICTLDVKPRTYFEDELPANPEKIHRVERGKPDTVPPELVEKGFKPPLRVTFRGLTREELEERKQYRGEGIDVDDPLEERITVEVPGIVIWRIVDLITFTQTIGDEVEAQSQMGDIFTLIMTAELSKITLKKFLETKEIYDEKLKDRLTDLTESWGIEIIAAGTKEYRGSRELNILIQGIAEAKAKKRSDALEGKGLGDREEAILRGRTKGLKYMKDELEVTSESILSVETARTISKEVDNLVAVGGESAFTDLMKIAATTAGMLKPKDKVSTKDVEVKEVDHE